LEHALARLAHDRLVVHDEDRDGGAAHQTPALLSRRRDVTSGRLPDQSRADLDRDRTRSRRDAPRGPPDRVYPGRPGDGAYPWPAARNKSLPAPSGPPAGQLVEALPGDHDHLQVGRERASLARRALGLHLAVLLADDLPGGLRSQDRGGALD